MILRGDERSTHLVIEPRATHYPSLITIAFTYLFGLDNTVVHTLMVAALAMILSLSLFTVAALDYPFKGDVRIHPAAFEQVLERFQESKLSDL